MGSHSKQNQRRQNKNNLYSYATDTLVRSIPCGTLITHLEKIINENGRSDTNYVFGCVYVRECKSNGDRTCTCTHNVHNKLPPGS